MQRSTAILAFLLLTFFAGSSLAQAAVKRFHLYATDGWLQLADGSRTYIWGFSDKPVKGSATLPGPTLVVNEGDTVEVTLTNLGFSEPVPDPPHTIHLHGLDVDQANDGVPHTSPDVPEGTSFTYRFTATHAGTYWYHCHVDTIQHLQMGMYGALIVHAQGGAQEAWSGGPSYDREVAFVLSELDPVWHQAVLTGRNYDRTDYHPRYFLINGDSFPEVMQNPADHIEGSVGQHLLIRLINAGYQSHSMHSHGYHFKVIASDGRPLPEPLDKDTLLIGPGERYDLLVIPDKPGEYPFHSHMITDNTNNGIYPGGMHTMFDVAPQNQPAKSGSFLWHPLYGNEPAPAAGEMPSMSGMAGMTGMEDTPGVQTAASATAPAGEVIIHARYNKFTPQQLTIKAGTKVTWVNDDLMTQHDVEIEFDGAPVRGPQLGYRQQWSYTFTKPGQYRYICTIHQGMNGTITVKE